jgi:hypothetical protein
MKRLHPYGFALLAALVLAAPSFAQGPEGGQGGRPLTAVLSGAEEVPGPGDEDGTGAITLRLNPGQEEICYDLAVDGIAAPTAAHIHRGTSGSSGGPVVTLEAPTDGASTGCVDAERDLIVEIIQNPASFYVNVHNDEFPAGAVRGQLSK